MTTEANGPAPTQASACLHNAEAVELLTKVPVAELARLAALADGRSRWLRVEGFADATYLQAVADAFGLHPLALEDVLHASPAPKLESYAHGYFMVLPRFSYGRRLHARPVCLFLGEGWVLSLSPDAVPEFDLVASRLHAGRGKAREGGADRVFHSLADAVIDGYPGLMTQLDQAFSRLDSRLQGKRPDSVVYGLRELRSDLFHLYTLLGGLHTALTALHQDRDDWMDDAVQPYVKDLMDHVHGDLNHTEILRESVAEAQQLYQAIQGQRTNDTMRVLTVMSAIFLPLSFIAGVYGMNFQFMPELAWPWGYGFALGLMAATAVGLLIFFARKGWLGKQDPRALRAQHHAEEAED